MRSFYDFRQDKYLQTERGRPQRSDCQQLLKLKRLTVTNKSLFKPNANTRLTSELDGWRLVLEMCVYIPFIAPLEVEQMSRQMALLARISPEMNLSTLLYTSSTFIYFS